jgi:hypothetical protein
MPIASHNTTAPSASPIVAGSRSSSSARTDVSLK